MEASALAELRFHTDFSPVAREMHIEDMRLQSIRNPRPIVANCNQRRGSISAQADVHVPASRQALERVEYDVEQRLFELLSMTSRCLAAGAP
jgi:hypothetical protein